MKFKNCIRKFKTDKNVEINRELIGKIIEKHSTERKRIEALKAYYDGLNLGIGERVYDDMNKPQNYLFHNYAAYITDNFVGYLTGKPITYKSNNEDLLDQINLNFMYNDEIDNNTTIAQEQSICGYAYELLYSDEDAIPRFKCLDTENTIVVYDNTIEEKELFAIRMVIDKINTDYQEEGVCYVYTKDETITYEYSNKSLGKEIDRVPNVFDELPIISYENNRQRTGDFEKVLSLIDAYDQANSDTANDFEYFTNALLVVSGILLEERDEEGRPIDLKNNRILNFADAGSKAEYLIKNINDTALENYKNRLNSDIHKFSNVCDLSDENFAGNLSGVAIKFKLQGMENITSIKESKFRKGLMRRIELIVSFLNIKKNSDYLYTEIKPVFTRNIPANDAETISTVKSLYGIISDKTLLAQIPFIEDIQQEIEAIEMQNEEKETYEFNTNTDKEEVEANEQE